MNDPATGQAAQAVITEIDDTSVRLLSRQQRRLTFPLRSFRLMWRFIQEAPAQPCAYADCPAQGYVQVNDLGRWVWVCQAHLPAHAAPFLPTDDPSNGPPSENRCPTCSASIQSPSSSHRVMDGHTIRRCGSCNTLWVMETAPGNAGGIWATETVQNVASLLESQGYRVRALLGRSLWTAVEEMWGTSVTHLSGVEARQQPELPPEAVILIGDRPRTNIQRLGGQPNRQSPGEAIPEEGSHWSHRESGEVIQVEKIRFATQMGQAGRRILIEARTTSETPRQLELWLEDFLRTYQTAPSVEVSEAPNLPPPCSVGEMWMDPSGRIVEILAVDERFVEVRLASGKYVEAELGNASKKEIHAAGALGVVRVGFFREKYRKAPPRKSALDRVLEDEED